MGGDATELEDGELSNDDNNNDNEEAKETAANPSPRRTRATSRSQNAR